MNQYYYSDGKEKNGPLSLEELKAKELFPSTLIWYEGLQSWTQLSQLPTLINELNFLKKSPPPLPIEKIAESLSNKETEISGELKTINAKLPSSNFEAIKPSKTISTWLIVWCSFHLFALLMSYSEVKIFNDAGEPQKNQFWPFVKFSETYNRPDWSGYRGGGSILNTTQESNFYGVFRDYDFTEFAFYVGVAIVFFMLSRTLNKPQSKIINS